MSEHSPASPTDTNARDEGENAITVSTLVGALLSDIVKARAIADRASLQVADMYLHHELLRGFTVPRMQIRDVEVNLNLAIASQVRGGFFLEDEEVRKNISYRLRDFLGSLPGHRDFKAYFRNQPELAARWLGGLQEMTLRFQRVLSKPEAGAEAVIHSLTVGVENYFYESAPGDLRLAVSALLVRPAGKSGRGDSIKNMVAQHIRSIVKSVDKSKPSSESGLDLEILVGAAQLEKLNPALLQSMKIAVSPSDRRWVASDQQGKKVYILGT